MDTDGVYRIEVTNAAGCVDTDEVSISFSAPPQLEAPADVAFCEGESALLEIQTDASTINWTLNGQVVAQNTDNLEVSENGEYIIEAISSEGCIVSESVNVEVNQNPDLEIGDIQLCPGETQLITLDNSFTNYEWTGVSGTGSEITVDYVSVTQQTSENASVVVTDDNGCMASESFTITYNPELDAQILSDSYSICIGESVQLQTSGGLYYEWLDADGSLSATDIASPVASPEASTMYTVNISDDCPTNFASFDISVNVNDLPEVDAGQDTCTIVGADLELMATGGVQYSWNNTDFIVGSTNQAIVTVNIEEDTSFVVTVVDENGCSNRDSVRVCILEDPFTILNAVTLITPNGDFVNDELVFTGLEAFPINKLTVFNRWGNVIFTKSGYQTDDIRWNGTRDGQELPADTYYYILEFADFRIKKSITLLRD